MHLFLALLGMKFHKICEKGNLTVGIKAFQMCKGIYYKEMAMGLCKSKSIRMFITELFIIIKC